MAVELELLTGTVAVYFKSHTNPRKRCMGEVLHISILKQVVRTVTVAFFNS
jgi:hypothetical protein